MSIRIIGDVHGKFEEYKELLFGVEKSLQLGDFGFSKAWGKLVAQKIDPENHKILGGNHDNYDWIEKFQPPNYLGDFGVWEEIFYIRGAYSIDKDMRIEGASWWRNEELSYSTSQKALYLYNEIKPNVVVTHDCPKSVKRYLVQNELKDHTSNLLEECFFAHQPKIWIFGHHHINFRMQVRDTEFIGLAELGVFEL